MDWRRLLAHVSGTVDRELMLRNEYLVLENRLLRDKLGKRVTMTDGERIALATLGKKLGRKVLGEIASIVSPDTILAWHRRLVARKWDYSRRKKRKPGRPRTKAEIEKLILRLAQENRGWGYTRIVGDLDNLGLEIGRQTVANVLKRHGITPAPERRERTPWKEFLKAHEEVLVAADFFTVEAWGLGRLVTWYILFLIHPKTRKVHLAGITPNPDETWMKQVARNLTMPEWGFLKGMRLLLHDRDSKFCAAFRHILRSAGIRSLRLPWKSPNLNAFAERWVRSVKEECLSKLILFGEASVRKAVEEFVAHYHGERPHQGVGNRLLYPARPPSGARDGPITKHSRLGGMLNFYYREAG